MRKFKIIIIFFSIISFRSFIYGGSSLSFLNIGVGADALALGNNGVILNSGNSLYWNPAAMTGIDKNIIYLNHKVWIADMSFDFIGYTHKISSNDRFGIGIMSLTMPDIPLTYDSSTSTGSFSAYSASIMIGYSRILDFIMNNISMGFNLKLLKSEVYTRTMIGFAGDVSLYYNYKTFKAGVNVKNIGQSPKFSGQELADNLPFQVLFGIGYGVLDNNLKFQVGGKYFVYNSVFKYGIGIDYALKIWKIKSVFRAGYQSSLVSYSILDNLTFGVGLGYENYEISYAIFSFHSVQFIHDISFSLKF